MSTLRAINLVEIFAGRKQLPGRCRRAAACLLLVLTVFGAGTATAARVDGLYAATVEEPSGALQAAFDEALSEVLVKVTGLPEAANPATRRQLFPNTGSVVQQYSAQPDGQVRVDFDAVAVRQVLDRAGLPVWGADRPLIAVWVAVDGGGGQRFILSDASATNFDRLAGAESGAGAELRELLADVAAERGLPIVFPLLDAEDLGQVSFADLWGDFRAPVQDASRRYGADAVLIGRARGADPATQGVRWTLVTADEDAVWQGDMASGPAEAAAVLSRRLATYADSAGSLRVLVGGVDTLDTYGQLLRYFRSLNIVDDVSVARVDGNQMEFSLVARGDAARLSRELDTNRKLARQEQVALTVDSGRLPDLSYVWVQAR
jgi:hypothetical protein